MGLSLPIPPHPSHQPDGRAPPAPTLGGHLLQEGCLPEGTVVIASSPLVLNSQHGRVLALWALASVPAWRPLWWVGPGLVSAPCLLTAAPDLGLSQILLPVETSQALSCSPPLHLSLSFALVHPNQT